MSARLYAHGQNGPDSHCLLWRSPVNGCGYGRDWWLWVRDSGWVIRACYFEILVSISERINCVIYGRPLASAWSISRNHQATYLQIYLKPQGNYEKGEHENLDKLILCEVHGKSLPCNQIPFTLLTTRRNASIKLKFEIGTLFLKNFSWLIKDLQGKPLAEPFNKFPFI